MQQIQHQMSFTGTLSCDFEGFFGEGVRYYKVMRDFSYENDAVPKPFCFYDVGIVPELFTKNIKIERTCKELVEDIVTLVNKVAGKNFQLTCFF